MSYRRPRIDNGDPAALQPPRLPAPGEPDPALFREFRCTRCAKLLGVVYKGWQGDPIWIKCLVCGLVIRFQPDGQHIVHFNGQ